jgi:hypothetical protein
MPLFAQLWYGFWEQAAWLRPSVVWQRMARTFAALSAGFHLLLSPWLLPLAGCVVVVTSPIEAAVHFALSQASGRDLVIISAPEYFYVKLLPVLAALEHRPAPRRLRALSFGPVPLHVLRTDPRSLEVRYEGGLLSSPLLELYRARSLVMPRGSVVQLQGLTIEVQALTAEGLIAAARFVFDAPLDDPRFCFLSWDGQGYRRFIPPAVGETVELPPASLHFSL